METRKRNSLYTLVPKFFAIIFILDLWNVKRYWSSFFPIFLKKEWKEGSPHIWTVVKEHQPQVQPSLEIKWVGKAGKQVVFIISWQCCHLPVAFTLAFAYISLYLTMSNYTENLDVGENIILLLKPYNDLINKMGVKLFAYCMFYYAFALGKAIWLSWCCFLFLSFQSYD